MADSRRDHIQAAVPLVATLCMVAGAVDVIAYILFGKIFIANMTGNTVLFAASVVLHNWNEAALRLVVIVAFLAGIFMAAAVLRRMTDGREWKRRMMTLAVEFAVLCWLALMPRTDTLHTLLLLVLAFAMGMQNNAFQRIGSIKLSTAFISGDLENLGEALAESGEQEKRAEGRGKTAVFFTSWIAYGAGAMMGAYGALDLKEKALWIPAGLVVLAAVMVIRSRPEPAPE
ncbi:MAG TPA: YoaK family protein [Acidobacteriaceae bacterium]|nr:YoaK family protein [Acidobacteriaceae bacterium]